MNEHIVCAFHHMVMNTFAWVWFAQYDFANEQNKNQRTTSDTDNFYDDDDDNIKIVTTSNILMTEKRAQIVNSIVRAIEMSARQSPTLCDWIEPYHIVIHHLCIHDCIQFELIHFNISHRRSLIDLKEKYNWPNESRTKNEIKRFKIRTKKTFQKCNNIEFLRLVKKKKTFFRFVFLISCVLHSFQCWKCLEYLTLNLECLMWVTSVFAINVHKSKHNFCRF